MLEAYPSLLVTKLFVPRVRAAHVRRDDLLSTLDGGLECKLILIAAAAGFGKTTLLADWSAAHEESVCWLSLDEGDNDPSRFLSYLIAAIQTHRAQVGQALLAALQSPQPPSIENALPILLNQLSASAERLIVILDDYHAIENRVIHSAVGFLLDHMPPHMTLVLLTRSDPPLPLSRLRARGYLLELRAAALQFSASEAAQFLNDVMHLQLSTEAISALERRTEGWIAGLQLAALAMQSLSGDKQAFVSSFTGSHRFVLDYLLEEVLTRQPPETRRFLLETSILRRLNAALCSMVTGIPNSHAMLDSLERNNLFLVPLDETRDWYRYHHLFADLLLARLQAESPGLLPDLRRRAAIWHEQNSLAEEAVGYALEAGDYDHAARLITGAASTVMRRSEVRTLLEWYRAFPIGIIQQHPRLCVQFGLAFALNGRWSEAETLLGYIDQNSDFPAEESLLLAYLVATYRQDADWLAAIAEEAAQYVDESPGAKLVLAIIYSIRGDMANACRLMAEAHEASARAGDSTTAATALFHLCRLLVFSGELHRAYDLCKQALEQTGGMGGAALTMIVLAQASLGRILIEWNRLDEAADHLKQAVEVTQLTGFVTGALSSAKMMLAEVESARGDVEGTNAAIDDSLSAADHYDPPPEAFLLKAYAARLWLAQGNMSPAAEWTREAARTPQEVSLFYPPSIALVVRARVLLAQRKPDEAVALLTHLIAQTHDLFTVEAFGVLALARQAQGDASHAALALEQALAIGEPENRVRAFLDLGAPMAKLLSQYLDAHPNHTFARHVLAAFPETPESDAVEPLSERELEVLRLIVGGYSNDEIAQHLTLAVSTVKWYVNTLYGKLHVKTRAQAIARAHTLRLVDS